MEELGLLDRTRRYVVGQVHVAEAGSEGRLASIRQLAEAWGVDHRAVARAYRSLEADGLVEVRGRSGVFLAASPEAGARRLAERNQWLTEVLEGAWVRRLTLAQVAGWLARCAAPPARCLCVESTEDHMVAAAEELRTEFGFAVTEHRLPTASHPSGSELGASDLRDLRDAIAESELVVTTAFHMEAVRPIAERMGRGLAQVTASESLVQELRRRLAAGPLRAVIADPAFATRMQHFLPAHVTAPDRLEVVLASDPRAAAWLDDEAALFTRAARRSLGAREHHWLPGHRFLSSASASAVAAELVRLRCG